MVRCIATPVEPRNKKGNPDDYGFFHFEARGILQISRARRSTVCPDAGRASRDIAISCIRDIPNPKMRGKRVRAAAEAPPLVAMAESSSYDGSYSALQRVRLMQLLHRLQCSSAVGIERAGMRMCIAKMIASFCVGGLHTKSKQKVIHWFKRSPRSGDQRRELG